jgi:hypothetical protein
MDGLRPSCTPRAFGAFNPALVRSIDDGTLEFGQRPDHVEGELAGRGRGVDGFGQRAELNAARREAG